MTGVFASAPSNNAAGRKKKNTKRHNTTLKRARGTGVALLHRIRALLGDKHSAARQLAGVAPTAAPRHYSALCCSSPLPPPSMGLTLLRLRKQCSRLVSSIGGRIASMVGRHCWRCILPLHWRRGHIAALYSPRDGWRQQKRRGGADGVVSAMVCAGVIISGICE